ncbi:MAG: hypothetical protein V3V22_04475 [Methylococcales bacterium]
MSTEKILLISVPESNSQLIKVVRVFIRKNYRLVADDQADVSIIDFDTSDAKVLVEELHDLYPGRTIICLSAADQMGDNIIHVKKPFKQDDLTQALNLARDTLNPTKVVVGEQMGGSINQAANAFSDKQAIKDRQVARTGVSKRSDENYYNPADYLQGVLKTAYSKAKSAGFNLRLEAWWEPIIIFPKSRKIWVNADDQKLQAFCRLPLKTFARHHAQGSDLNAAFKISPEPMLNTEKLAGALQSMDAFLWKVAWWNAGGQLPLGITEREPLKLKSWPNITRLLCPDHAVQICALLFHAPVSALRISELLDIDRKEVYGFISAANALGLIETTQKQPIMATPQPTMDKSQPTIAKTAQSLVTPESRSRSRPVRNKGLLRRILSRINRK